MSLVQPMHHHERLGRPGLVGERLQRREHLKKSQNGGTAERAQPAERRKPAERVQTFERFERFGGANQPARRWSWRPRWASSACAGNGCGQEGACNAELKSVYEIFRPNRQIKTQDQSPSQDYGTATRPCALPRHRMASISQIAVLYGRLSETRRLVLSFSRTSAWRPQNTPKTPPNHPAKKTPGRRITGKSPMGLQARCIRQHAAQQAFDDHGHGTISSPKGIMVRCARTGFKIKPARQNIDTTAPKHND